MLFMMINLEIVVGICLIMNFYIELLKFNDIWCIKILVVLRDYDYWENVFLLLI